MFNFSKAYSQVNLVTRSNIVTLSNVRNAPGVDGSRDGSSQLAGTPDSFIEIANRPGGELDTRYSMTILAMVFPTGNAGPILSYQEHGLGVQVWQEEGGILTASFNRRDYAQPPSVQKDVLKMNAWNFIGASYNYDSGYATLWHDGKQVETACIGARMELATQFPVRIGAIADGGFAFSGKISSLQIFPQALGIEQVMAAAGRTTESMYLM